MGTLFDETGLSVHLAVLDQFEIVFLERISAEGHELPSRLRRQPSYCTGLGKAIMAYAGSEYVEAVIRQGLAGQTPSTIRDGDELRRCLEQVRTTGVAFDKEEAALGIGCVAAPIRGAGRAIAAVSVTGLIGSIDVDLLAPPVRVAATEIWANLLTSSPRPLSPVRARSSRAASASSLERAAEAELNQWLKYDDWL
jgi:DNA-binding IclR family transcriptional regulator